MKLRHHYLICLCVTLLAISFASTHVSYACSASGNPPTLEETVATADVIVVAEVVDTYITPSAHATLHVEKYLKGSGPDILVSEGYGYGGGDCRNRVVSGLQGIFYLDGDSNSHETLTASYAYPYSAVSDLDLETIKQIVQITGQETLPTSFSFQPRNRAFDTFLTGVVIAIFTIVLPLIVALCFLVVFGKVGIFVVRLSVRRVKALTSQRTAA